MNRQSSSRRRPGSTQRLGFSNISASGDEGSWRFGSPNETRNIPTQAGLGLPLPVGGTAVYQQRGATRLLVGLGTIGDVARDEPAKLSAGTSRQVVALQRIERMTRHIALSNANPFEVTVEIAVGSPGDPAFEASSGRLVRVDGVQTWRVTVPGNSSVQLAYTVPRR